MELQNDKRRYVSYQLAVIKSRLVKKQAEPQVKRIDPDGRLEFFAGCGGLDEASVDSLNAKKRQHNGGSLEITSQQIPQTIELDVFDPTIENNLEHYYRYSSLTNTDSNVVHGFFNEAQCSLQCTEQTQLVTEVPPQKPRKKRESLLQKKHNIATYINPGYDVQQVKGFICSVYDKDGKAPFQKLSYILLAMVNAGILKSTGESILPPHSALSSFMIMGTSQGYNAARESRVKGIKTNTKLKAICDATVKAFIESQKTTA